MKTTGETMAHMRRVGNLTYKLPEREYNNDKEVTDAMYSH